MAFIMELIYAIKYTNKFLLHSEEFAQILCMADFISPATSTSAGKNNLNFSNCVRVLKLSRRNKSIATFPLVP